MRTNDGATLVFRHGTNMCEQLVRHDDECHLRAADREKVKSVIDPPVTLHALLS